MKISHENNESVSIIKFNGNLDINSQSNFFNYFINILPKSNKYIAVNFEMLKYMDSSGIGILVKCIGECKKKKKELILFGLNQNIMKILKTANLNNFFNILKKDEFQKRFHNISELDNFF